MPKIKLTYYQNGEVQDLFYDEDTRLSEENIKRVFNGTIDTLNDDQILKKDYVLFEDCIFEVYNAVDANSEIFEKSESEIEEIEDFKNTRMNGIADEEKRSLIEYNFMVLDDKERSETEDLKHEFLLEQMEMFNFFEARFMHLKGLQERGLLPLDWKDAHYWKHYSNEISRAFLYGEE